MNKQQYLYCQNCPHFKKELEKKLRVEESILDVVSDMKEFANKCFTDGCKERQDV